MAELTQGQQQLFREPNFVVVSTVGKDGGPRATVAWVDFDGGQVLLNSAAHRGWPKNLRRDPRVAVTLIDSKNPYHKVTVTGRVVEMTEEGAVDHIHQLAHKYRGKDYKGDMDRVLIKVEPESVHEYGAS